MEGLKNVVRDLYKDKPLFWTLVVVAGVVLFVVIHNIAQQNSTAPTGPTGPSSPSGSGSNGSSGGSRGGKHQKHGKRNGGGGGYGAGPVLAGAYDGSEYGAGQSIPIYERLADAGAVGPQMSF